GIITLSTLAIVLIISFNADVTKLIGLYAIGVFISFTLSQTGMFKKWITQRGKHWVLKAFVNGLGACVTATAVIVIAITKFHQGAWIVVFLIPLLVFLMLKIHRHYLAVKKQLKVSSEELKNIDLTVEKYNNLVIVPIESLNQSSLRALKFARTISDNIIAFTVAIDEESGEKIKEKYSILRTSIPLVVRYSPYRKVLEPLLNFIESEEYGRKKGDMITVIFPQFSVKSWWHKFLHNHTRIFVQRELLKHKHIVVAVMPLQLKRDKEVN
ncbi:MAG: amino acid permease, partial [Vallitaleaceae bacterium]|nr:amino acid permease [Vallitaleaceae bacterium]